MLAALGAMLATMAEGAAAAGTAIAEGAAAAGTAVAEGALAAGETVAGTAGEATAGEAASAVASSASEPGRVISSLVDKAKKSAGVPEGSGISRFFSGAGNSLAGKNPIVKLDNGDVDWYGTVGGFTGEVGKAVLNRQRNGRLLPIVTSVVKGSMDQ